MRLIGLTGGIGSGKSTVSSMLTELDFALVDADAITRSLQEPGQPVLDAIVETFGPQILLANGQLDRAKLANRVFTDRRQLERLNAIVHPAVGERIATRLDELAKTDQLVVLDIPLLVESGRDDLERIIVVDVDPEIAVERLVAYRGFSPEDARARIANQADRGARLAIADHVIDNHGTVEDLARQVDFVARRLKHDLA